MLRSGPSAFSFGHSGSTKTLRIYQWRQWKHECGRKGRRSWQTVTCWSCIQEAKIHLMSVCRRQTYCTSLWQKAEELLKQHKSTQCPKSSTSYQNYPKTQPKTQNWVRYRRIPSATEYIISTPNSKKIGIRPFRKTPLAPNITWSTVLLNGMTLVKT